MRRKIYSKMLKKRQQKSSTRLYNGVIVRKWMQNKSHHHVHESKTFSKKSTRCKQTLTPSSRALTKSRHELIPGHNPQTLTTRIVKKLYLRDLKHIRNQLRCDRNVRTSNVSKEERYWTINPVYVEVELLDKHERTCDRDVTQWLRSPTMNDKGKVGVGKVQQKDLVFRMNASFREVLRKCLKGIIIMEPNVRRWRIRRWRSTETKAFRARVDLRFGAINTTNVNRIRGRKREEQSEKSQAILIISIILKIRYVCMGNAWTCDMQNKKASWAQPNPNLSAHKQIAQI